MKHTIPKPPRLWTPDRRRTLATRYPRESTLSLAREFGTTPAAIRQAAHREKVKK